MNKQIEIAPTLLKIIEKGAKFPEELKYIRDFCEKRELQKLSELGKSIVEKAAIKYNQAMELNGLIQTYYSFNTKEEEEDDDWNTTTE